MPRNEHSTPRTIIGISLSPATASAVKAEAKKRSISLKTLFDEMWTDYQAKSKAK